MKKPAFLIIESLIYISFIVLDILRINSTYIKYISIIMCLIYALYNRKKNRSIAMAFTLLADLFLLVLNSHYEIGLLCFIVVQMTYLYFLGNINKGYFNVFLLARGFFIMAGILISLLYMKVTILNVLVIIYFFNLVFNAMQSYVCNQKMFFIGLLLFIFCDICVGIHNINTANNIATFLMWIFYLPSQVLIVLS